MSKEASSPYKKSAEFDRSCPTCKDYRIATLAHVEGPFLIIDYINTPVCLHTGMQKEYIRDHFPADVKQLALDNLPLPFPVGLLSMFCRMKHWQKIPAEAVKPVEVGK